MIFIDAKIDKIPFLMKRLLFYFETLYNNVSNARSVQTPVWIFEYRMIHSIQPLNFILWRLNTPID